MYHTQYKSLTSSGYMYHTQCLRIPYVIRRRSAVLQFSSRLPLRKTEDGKTDLSTVPRLGWHYYTIMFASICWWWTRRRCGKRRKNAKFGYIIRFVSKVLVNSCLYWNKDFCSKNSQFIVYSSKLFSYIQQKNLVF